MSHHRFLRAAGTLEIDANIRNPRIYCVNSCFLMFSGPHRHKNVCKHPFYVHLSLDAPEGVILK